MLTLVPLLLMYRWGVDVELSITDHVHVVSVGHPHTKEELKAMTRELTLTTLTTLHKKHATQVSPVLWTTVIKHPFNKVHGPTTILNTIVYRGTQASYFAPQLTNTKPLTPKIQKTILELQ